MVLMRRVALNGTELDSLDNSIIISKVDEEEAVKSISAVSRACPGQRVTNNHRDYIGVTVSFYIRLKKDSLAGRDAVLDKVRKWARNGGYLTVNYKIGKRLKVTCTELPGGNDLANWTAEYQVAFRAYEIPYWTTAAETSMTSAYVSAGTTVSATNNGTEDTPIDFSMEMNASATGTTNTLTVSLNGKTISFSGLGMVAGDKLRYYHDENGLALITLTHNGTTTSAYSKRTEQSADELYVAPGVNSVGFSATGNARYNVSFRGRYA